MSEQRDGKRDGLQTYSLSPPWKPVHWSPELIIRRGNVYRRELEANR